MCYSLRISDPPSIEKYADKEAMQQLSAPPPKWNLDADEELAKFMADHINKHEASLGNISRYVESVQVSSVSLHLLNPLTSRSDLHVTSPINIHSLFSKQVMRILKLTRYMILP